MLVAQWGNSLAVRLPASMVADMGLSAGDEIELSPRAAGANRFVAEVAKKQSKLELLQTMRKYQSNWIAETGYKWDREEANARR